ncbi:kinase [Pseudoalteromonas aurantia]|nr:kinase [Pseudoalteromonas aurantia]
MKQSSHKFMAPWQSSFIKTYTLTDSYLSDAEPIVQWVKAEYTNMMGLPFCLGLNGAQGSGKSTLAAYLAAALGNDGLSVAVVSLDDFYLSPQERQMLATNQHPLLKTRGVPGTHSILQAVDVVESFKAQRQFILPRFDKSQDKPLQSQFWQKVETPPDILIFEGWCIGLKPEPNVRLQSPVNSLEAKHDSSGTYRQYVNTCLAQDYQQLFSLLDRLIYLDVHTFERVYQWRLQQERQLKMRLGEGMNDHEVAEFIQYFERLTEWGLTSLPKQSDLTIFVNEAHRFVIE